MFFRCNQFAGKHFAIGDVLHDLRPLAAVGMWIEPLGFEGDVPGTVRTVHVVEHVGLIDEHIHHQIFPCHGAGSGHGLVEILQGAFVGSQRLVNPPDVMVDPIKRQRVAGVAGKLLGMFQLHHSCTEILPVDVQFGTVCTDCQHRPLPSESTRSRPTARNRRQNQCRQQQKHLIHNAHKDSDFFLLPIALHKEKRFRRQHQALKESITELRQQFAHSPVMHTFTRSSLSECALPRRMRAASP